MQPEKIRNLSLKVAVLFYGLSDFPISQIPVPCSLVSKDPVQARPSQQALALGDLSEAFLAPQMPSELLDEIVITKQYLSFDLGPD